MWIKQQLCIYSPVDICMWSKHLVTTTFIVPFPLLYWLQPSWDVPRFWVWEYQWQQHHGRSGQQQQQQQLLQLQSSVFPMLLHEWLKKNKETSSSYSTNSWPSSGNERVWYDGASGLLSWLSTGLWLAETHCRLEWKLYMWSRQTRPPDQSWQIWNSICDGVYTFKDGLWKAYVSWWTLKAGLDQLPINFFHKTEIMQQQQRDNYKIYCQQWAKTVARH